MTVPYEYTYQVYWSEENDAYIATVLEFPSLSYVGDDCIHPMEALGGIVALVREVLADMYEHDETPPEALGDSNHKG